MFNRNIFYTNWTEMNICYTFIAFGLCTGFVHINAVSLEIAPQLPYSVIASDFDDVLTQSDSFWTYVSEAKKALGFRTFSKGILHAFTSPQFLKDIWAMKMKTLRYKDGRKVIGATAYVEFLAQNDMPFLSEDQKQKLIAIAWKLKPNVELIEFYHHLQSDLHIPIYVWTDNDKDGYDRKIIALNTELAKRCKRPFEPDGVQYATASTPTDPGLSKDHTQYFKKAYDTLQTRYPELLQTQSKVLFIDDKEKNVINARKAAKEEKIKLDAFQYTGKRWRP